MRLFVGLGNPGASYAGHRHNIGFMALDRLVERFAFPAWKSKFRGRSSEGPLGGEKVLLLEPLTYMNESGRSVAEAARFFKLAPADVVVFHDELDLAPFKCRVKLGGGVAGHNGLRSIAAVLGTRDFKRVRLGIGHPGDKNRVTGYVLGDFAKAEREDLDRFLDAVADAAPKLAAGDDAGFMNRVALEMQRDGD
ncbi:MAG: aminoacyl-tRNA hydrolase [Alphaproteobacteria bacterium]|nr:aminoacyl-tRNA hydrolase [Alphaproteobacteria bacterium]